MKRILFAVAPSIIALTANAQKNVTATWRLRKNEFKIWALGRQRLQIDFFGTDEHESASGPTANIGDR